MHIFIRVLYIIILMLHNKCGYELTKNMSMCVSMESVTFTYGN